MDGQARAKVMYQESFWIGVQEVCAISEPLVNVFRLVDGEKTVMRYLYETMDKAKEVVHRYYEDKREQEFNK
jgi:hypothetical protein